MPRSIYPLLSQFLTLVDSGFADAGVSLPNLQYVAAGMAVAYDTEQVTTNMLRIYPGRPSAEMAWQYEGEEVFTIDAQVAIVRYAAVPDDNGQPPSADVLTDQATIFGQDCDTLLSVLLNIKDQHLLLPVGIPVGPPSVTAYGPEGGVVGVLGVISCQLC